VLIFGRRHLERVLSIYVRHYNCARPHRALDLDPPRRATAEIDPTKPTERADILGGLVHEYRRAA
jgi:hypothetical protein